MHHDGDFAEPVVRIVLALRNIGLSRAPATPMREIPPSGARTDIYGILPEIGGKFNR